MKKICLLIGLLATLGLRAQTSGLEGSTLPAMGGGSLLSDDLISASDDPLDGDGTVPVDGGLTLLLAAGAAYGARRLRRRQGD